MTIYFTVIGVTVIHTNLCQKKLDHENTKNTKDRRDRRLLTKVTILHIVIPVGPGGRLSGNIQTPLTEGKYPHGGSDFYFFLFYFIFLFFFFAFAYSGRWIVVHLHTPYVRGSNVMRLELAWNLRLQRFPILSL